MTNVILLSPYSLPLHEQTKSEARQEAEEAAAEREGGGSEEDSAAMPQEEVTDQCRWFNSGMKLGVDWSSEYKGGDNGNGQEGGSGSEYEGTGFEYDECHRKRQGPENSEAFRPSEWTLNSLPKFDKNNLGRWGVDTLGDLALKFFEIMFPAALIAFLVSKVRQGAHRCSPQA